MIEDSSKQHKKRFDLFASRMRKGSLLVATKLMLGIILYFIFPLLAFVTLGGAVIIIILMGFEIMSFLKYQECVFYE